MYKGYVLVATRKVVSTKENLPVIDIIVTKENYKEIISLIDDIVHS